MPSLDVLGRCRRIKLAHKLRHECCRRGVQSAPEEKAARAVCEVGVEAYGFPNATFVWDEISPLPEMNSLSMIHDNYSEMVDFVCQQLRVPKRVFEGRS